MAIPIQNAKYAIIPIKRCKLTFLPSKVGVLFRNVEIHGLLRHPQHIFPQGRESTVPEIHARNKRLDCSGLRHAFPPYEGGFRDRLKYRLRDLVRVLSEADVFKKDPQWFDSRKRPLTLRFVGGCLRGI